MSDHILIEKSGGVLTLTMNRPDKKNALTRAMYQTLGDAIDQAAFDKDVRCVVIQGNGDMFTAGNDNFIPFVLLLTNFQSPPYSSRVKNRDWNTVIQHLFG